MPTQTEIAAHWGVTQSRVAQLVKDGCPTNSLKAADNWRAARGQKRVATNSKSDCKFADERGKGRPQKPRKAARTGDSLLDALNNAIAVADGAFEDYEFARVNKLATRSARLSEHNKAIQARFQAEKAYREELERRGILVTKTDITERCRRCLDAVIRLVKKMPNETGPQANPQDPLLAMKVMQKAVDQILRAGQEALNGL